MSPRSTVLSSPELLELILLHLPPKDLLLSQKISRSIKSLISNSPRIQQALFLRPIPIPSSATKFHLNQTYTLNPLFRGPFLPWFVNAEKRFNRPGFSCLKLLDFNARRRDGGEKREAFFRKEASWRRMFFVQPTPKELVVRKIIGAARHRREWEKRISFVGSGGVTMDAVYDIAVDWVSKKGAISFGVRVVEQGEEEGGLTLELGLWYRDMCVKPGYTIRDDDDGLKDDDDANKFWTVKNGGPEYREVKYEMQPLEDSWWGFTEEEGAVGEKEFKRWMDDRERSLASYGT